MPGRSGRTARRTIRTANMLDPCGDKSNRASHWRACEEIDLPNDPLFAVRNPNVFDLRGVFEEPAPLGEIGIEPVDLPAFVGPDLF
jgi:hypothetical protein